MAVLLAFKSKKTYCTKYNQKRLEMLHKFRFVRLQLYKPHWKKNLLHIFFKRTFKLNDEHLGSFSCFFLFFKKLN